uniref:tripartite motif-containing protein 26-like n=1 Tax=Panthera onca TaxID=9690 RepID=UPI002954974A
IQSNEAELGDIFCTSDISWGGGGGGPGWGQEQSLRGFSTPQQRSHALLPSLCPQKKLQDQRQDIVAEFEQSHQFLRERERHLLDQLAKLEQELTEGREKYKTKGVSELARLALLISELEGKAQQPAAELMQDSRDFLNRYPRKKFWIGKPIARVVKKKTGEFSEKVLSLQRGLREFQGEGQGGALGWESGREALGSGIRSQAGRALAWGVRSWESWIESGAGQGGHWGESRELGRKSIG